MRYVKWTFLALVALLIFSFFDYVLPQHDVVRITGTEVIRTDFTRFNRLFYAQADSGNVENTTRDVRLINTVRPNGRVMVYRNEDTGWIWPPYFKFDSSNVQAEASNLTSTQASPSWVIVTKYGWRIPFLSIYPNVVALRPASGPDASVFPWVNIVILTALVVLMFLLWRMWAQFRERTIEPLIVDAEEAWDRVDNRADMARDRAKGLWGRIRAWLDTWRGKPRK